MPPPTEPLKSCKNLPLDRNVKLTRGTILSPKDGAIKRGLVAATGDVLGSIDAGRSIHPDSFMQVADAIR